MQNYTHRKKSKYKWSDRYHKDDRWKSQRTYKYVIYWGRFKEKVYYQISDDLDQATQDRPPNDAVYLEGGNCIDGVYITRKWVCLWEIPKDHPFQKFIEDNPEIME